MEFVLGGLHEILIAVQNLTALFDGVAGKNTHDGTAGNGLAGAGLTDDSEGFSGIQIKAYIAYCLYLTVGCFKRNS